MRKKQNKRSKTTKVFKNPKDKQTERIVYFIIFLLALFGLIIGYKMIKGFEGMEIQKIGHFNTIEKEKEYDI